MANQDAPFGFRPVKTRSGGPVGHPNHYVIADGYATSLFFGDAVKLDGNGTVVIGTAGDAIVGIFAGCYYTASDGSYKFSKHWPASTVSTDAIALVHDDPGLILLAQSDGSMTAADIGQFCDIDTSQSGSTLTGMSKQQTSATGGTEDNFRIYGVMGVGQNQIVVRDSAGNQGNSATGTNALVLVSIVNHVAAGSAVGVEA